MIETERCTLADIRARRCRHFYPSATCPKCGHGAIHTSYHARGGVRCDDHGQGMPWDPEHLERTCQRCHYEWAEAVLPAPATDAGKDEPR